MAIRKSDLYSSLRASCDELRGASDTSQSKYYARFVRYISDKGVSSNDFAHQVTISKGASFKGNCDIGHKFDNQVTPQLFGASTQMARTL